MSSAENLKRLVNDRLTAAADEIFGLFQKTIAEYEEELRRQRKLLNIAWSSPPVVQLHRIREHDISVRTTGKVSRKTRMLDVFSHFRSPAIAYVVAVRAKAVLATLKVG